MYEVRLLEDEREEGDARTMVEGYVKSAVELRNATDRTFLSRHAGEVSRAVSHLPGSCDDSARSLFDLHRRHGESVFSVLEDGVRNHAADILAGTLPPHSLLAMAISRSGELALVAPVGSEPAQEMQADDSVDHGRSTELRMAIDSGKKRVVLEGMKALTGRKSFRLLKALTDRYVQDRDAGRSPNNYAFFNAKDLAGHLHVEEASLRKQVSRLRKAVSRDFQLKYDVPLTHDVLIETKEWHGYRLNPNVRILDPAEIAS
jgi:hypothetical protein